MFRLLYLSGEQPPFNPTSHYFPVDQPIQKSYKFTYFGSDGVPKRVSEQVPNPEANPVR